MAQNRRPTQQSTRTLRLPCRTHPEQAKGTTICRKILRQRIPQRRRTDRQTLGTQRQHTQRANVIIRPLRPPGYSLPENRQATHGQTPPNRRAETRTHAPPKNPPIRRACFKNRTIRRRRNSRTDPTRRLHGSRTFSRRLVAVPSTLQGATYQRNRRTTRACDGMSSDAPDTAAQRTEATRGASTISPHNRRTPRDAQPDHSTTSVANQPRPCRSSCRGNNKPPRT